MNFVFESLHPEPVWPETWASISVFFGRFFLVIIEHSLTDVINPFA
jgi:hypothetical protein